MKRVFLERWLKKGFHWGKKVFHGTLIKKGFFLFTLRKKGFTCCRLYKMFLPCALMKKVCCCGNNFLRELLEYFSQRTVRTFFSFFHFSHFSQITFGRTIGIFFRELLEHFSLRNIRAFSFELVRMYFSDTVTIGTFILEKSWKNLLRELLEHLS